MAHDFIREKAKQMEHEIKFSDKEEEELNDDLIYRLLQCITAGHFLNLALSNGSLRAGYQVISAFSPMTTEPVIARVFRTSTLCLNDQMPTYILFNELLNLNETNYITILSSINLNWLKSVSSQWYTTINGANLHTISYESYTLKNVGATLQRAVVGKRNCNLNKLEELTQAIIDVDYKQAKLTIWSRQVNLEKAKNIVEKIVETAKQKLLTEAEEIQIVGRTRILMGAGGVSQMILVEDEFTRIIITRLPTTVTEERIKDLCEPFGQVRKIDFLRQNSSGSCAAISYSTIEEARATFVGLNGYIEQDHEIVVSGSCLKSEVTAGKQNCRLKAIWHLTPSTGNGIISFSQEKSALDACQLFKRLYYQCHYERSTNIPTSKVIYYLGENSGKAFINFESLQQAQNVVLRMNTPLTIQLARDKQNRTGSVLFQHFPKDFDEEDVRTFFQSCNGLINVQVLRGRKGRRFQKPDSAEDDIKSLFNHYKSFQHDTIIVNPNILNGKLEAYVEFLDMTDLKQAIEEMDGKAGIIGCGKVRLTERIQQKKEDTKRKKKEEEYIVKFQRLDKSCDRYDLIKILKENHLYDNVKNVVIFRQKLEDNTSTTIWNTTASEEEKEIGLVRLRSMLLSEEDLFNSVPDCQISSFTPNGTITALVFFKDPIDIITAIERYDNKEIQLSRRASKLPLIPSISHEIFINAALTKAIPEKIQQAIQRIRERFKRVYIKGVPSKKTEKSATMKIFIDGDDIEQITMAKIEFDNLMKGMEYKFEDDSEKVTLLGRVGTTILQRIQNETGSYIWWNYSNHFLRIYGSDQASADAKKRIKEYIRDTLKKKKHTITLDMPPGYVREVLRRSANYHENLEKSLALKSVL